MPRVQATFRLAIARLCRREPLRTAREGVELSRNFLRAPVGLRSCLRTSVAFIRDGADVVADQGRLVGGGGIVCDPPPGRIFLVGPRHSFEDFAEVIDAAFARWDLSHLHDFELADGRLIGFPDDSLAPEMVWLDHAKLKVVREVKPGETFDYVFDLGDNWRHRCTVLAREGRPA